MGEPAFFSRAQIEQFDRDGFVVVREMYTPQEIGQVSDWTDELTAFPEEPGKTMMYFESSSQGGGRILCRIENFVPYHAGFHRLIMAHRMAQAVAELLREPAILFKEKINFKLPGGDGFKEHQDVQAGWNEYAGVHITAMLAIDNTSEENGSLELIAGMHRKGLLGRMWEPLKDEDTGYATYQAVHCRPGDAVFFDSYTPHRSAPNRTAGTRRVLYATYNRASAGDLREKYYADKRRSYPPDIERVPGKNYNYKV